MTAVMKQVWQKCQGRFRAYQVLIVAKYGENPEQEFRAKNLLYICGSALTIVSSLLVLFLLENFGLLGRTAKVIFVPVFLIIIGILAKAIQLVLKGRLNTAKFLVTILASTVVPLAISITGGFPNSAASAAIMIPIVMSFCLYEGNVSMKITLVMICFLIAQWIGTFFFRVDFPNFVSDANPEFNTMVAIIATLFITCFVLLIFDHSNRKYIQAANAAMVSKSNFLANTSHEIRTPMNGIIGLSEVMMRTTSLDRDQLMYMEAIHQSGTALMTVINDILDYSRLDAGRVSIKQEPFNLYALMHELRTLMTITAADKNVILECKYPDNMPQRFLGDASRIRQILINLTGNAIKFTDNGYVRIKVDMTPKPLDAQIRISVEDTGIGIPSDKLESIFERFTQIDTGNTQKYSGTGLGLSISQKLVQLMGGKMGVNSQEQMGSTFWFDLELPLADPLTKPETESNVDKASVNAQVGALVVSENPGIIDLYGTALTRRGFRVFHTANSNIVNEWMKSLDYDSSRLPLMLVDGELSATVQAKLRAGSYQAGKNFIRIAIRPGTPTGFNPFLDGMDAVIESPAELGRVLLSQQSRAN